MIVKDGVTCYLAYQKYDCDNNKYLIDLIDLEDGNTMDVDYENIQELLDDNQLVESEIIIKE